MTREQFFKQSLKVMQLQASSYCSSNSCEHCGGPLKSVEQLDNKYRISEPSQIENKTCYFETFWPNLIFTYYVSFFCCGFVPVSLRTSYSMSVCAYFFGLS